MPSDLVPFEDFDAVSGIHKKMSTQGAWAAKEKRNRIDKRIKFSPPPKGPHSSRPDFVTNGTVNVPPPPAVFHRRPGADQNF